MSTSSNTAANQKALDDLFDGAADAFDSSTPLSPFMIISDIQSAAFHPGPSRATDVFSAGIELVAISNIQKHNIIVAAASPDWPIPKGTKFGLYLVLQITNSGHVILGLADLMSAGKLEAVDGTSFPHIGYINPNETPNVLVLNSLGVSSFNKYFDDKGIPYAQQEIHSQSNNNLPFGYEAIIHSLANASVVSNNTSSMKEQSGLAITRPIRMIINSTTNFSRLFDSKNMGSVDFGNSQVTAFIHSKLSDRMISTIKVCQHDHCEALLKFQFQCEHLTSDTTTKEFKKSKILISFFTESGTVTNQEELRQAVVTLVNILQRISDDTVRWENNFRPLIRDLDSREQGSLSDSYFFIVKKYTELSLMKFSAVISDHENEKLPAADIDEKIQHVLTIDKFVLQQENSNHQKKMIEDLQKSHAQQNQQRGGFSDRKIRGDKRVREDKDKDRQDKDPKRPNPEPSNPNSGKIFYCLTTVLYAIGKGDSKKCNRDYCTREHNIPRKPWSKEIVESFKHAISFYRGRDSKNSLFAEVDANARS